MFGEADADDLTATWAEGLGRFDAADLKRALEAMPSAYADFPPTLPQFVALCRDARNVRTQTTAKLDYNPRGKMPDEVKALIAKMKVGK